MVFLPLWYNQSITELSLSPAADDLPEEINDEPQEQNKINAFFAQTDEHGISNLAKTKKAKIIRRIASTDPQQSVEASDSRPAAEYPLGVIVEQGKLIGFGIHIYNEDVYPLQYFEIYLRDCDLTGTLDVSDCEDMLFLDIYHNRISAIHTANMPSMRILGIQDNQIEALDPSELPLCQGIDAGKNRLRHIDVSRNAELVELYLNDNRLAEIHLQANQKLKYFYCHNNEIAELDTRANPLLRHLDCCGNPMKIFRGFAPQSDGRLPLEISAGEGGFIGIKYCPIYNAQWKETGKWQQRYFAYPQKGQRFIGWYTNGVRVSDAAILDDPYGTGRILHAVFEKE